MSAVPRPPPEPLLRIEGLSHAFRVRARGSAARVLWAVADVDLDVARGETVAVVGESGCGKSTLARCVLRLLRPTRGRLLFGGRDLAPLGRCELRPIRRQMQIVFQEPRAALNPRLTAAATLREPLLVHRLAPPAAVAARVAALCDMVGLGPELLPRFPHELSGGQCQRLVLARALSVEPELLVADEPTSNLDVSVQAQVLNLLAEMKTRLGLTYLFISHDLHLVRRQSDRVAVMYLGRLVEVSPTGAVFSSPLHPYTRALWAATPRLAGSVEPALVAGEPPSAVAPPSGCAFHPRCPLAEARCQSERPVLRCVGDDRRVACHRV
jgi:oligopeptide/dipeptide ABC transporter ATP-binding protein